MNTINQSLMFFNTVNGVIATIASVLFLITLGITCRFKRDEKKQDKWATFFQNWFHISFYASLFLIAIDHLSESAKVYSLMTDYMSPPISDFSICAAGLCWCGYRLRRHWIIKHGMMLTDDLQVKPRTRNEAASSVR